MDMFGAYGNFALTFTSLWASLADDKLTVFFFTQENIGFDISCKLSP